MAKFKTGDVVQLKSGGPEMTVGSYDESNQKKVSCVWFVNSEIKRNTFWEDQLEMMND